MHKMAAVVEHMYACARIHSVYNLCVRVRRERKIKGGNDRGRRGERITGIRTTLQSADTGQLLVLWYQKKKKKKRIGKPPIGLNRITRYRNTRVGGRALLTTYCGAFDLINVESRRVLYNYAELHFQAYIG